MNRKFHLMLMFAALVINAFSYASTTTTATSTITATSTTITTSTKDDTTKIVLLSINDQHAKIDNYGKLKALVDSIRRVEKHVLLFSAGDNFTGNPVVDMYPDKGYPIIDVMNMAGFNVSAIGNHEFDYTQEILAKRMAQANFPFISANIKKPDGSNAFKPYIVLTLDNGLRVAVVSSIQLGYGGLPDSHPANLKGLSFSDGVQEILKYRNLKDSCDIFVALTHIGFERDMELASLMPELDVIFGGHTHTLTKPSTLSNNIHIIQSGSNVRSLAKATVYLTDAKVVKVVPEMLSIVNFRNTDQQVERSIAKYNDNKELNKVIGVAEQNITGSDELGSLMTDAIAALDEIEIAFQNEGGIRIEALNQGPITIKDVYKLDPFGNEVVLLKLKPHEIKSLIINSYNKNSHDVDLQVSGMTYNIITDKDKNAVDVIMHLSSGKKMKKNKTYNVGLSSYVASTYSFDHKDKGKSLFVVTSDLLIKFIANRKTINYAGVKRIEVK